MKIVGTNEEVSKFLNSICWQTTWPELYIDVPSEYFDKIRIPDGPIGTYCGVKIDIEIVEPTIYIGIITSGLTENETRLYIEEIAKKHKKCLSSYYDLKYSKQKCYANYMDGAHIEGFRSCSCVRGYKFDELWMDSLPPNWDEVDLCIKSVIGCKEKIHFFKELFNKEKRAI